MRRKPTQQRPDDLDVATVFTVTVDEQPRTRRFPAGIAIDIGTHDGLTILTPVLGPASVVVLRLITAQPGRTWHIADVAGQLGLAVRWTRNALVRLEAFGWLQETAPADETSPAEYHVFRSSPLSINQTQRLHPEVAARYARLSGLAGSTAPSEHLPA
ncbi:MAG TPA: hypothetical protein VNQ73_16670 [Ilumatobacter sp.]|nr:hypothetical protein [Ilumatobacter sp.]